ncbi:MAG: sigma-70 family RNA polymerase sigma factor [Lachnospiraceae bacterium]|nr:sigma-70 family RNA polymerase sigma factor [Lachnospiraceae bacterium]
MESILCAAMQKCGNIHDAEDLTQEVVLAALTCPREVANVKQWMLGVLNHKYYDLLRKKYRLPIISIDLVTEEAEPAYEECETDRPSEEQVRREVAYLAEKYREVIVRHYLYGEKVEEIAAALCIPKGTVLSRLAYGREQMKKGFDSMESYGKQSYRPERLEITCNGRPGLKDEPFSLVSDDLMKQNILIVAYEKPLTAVEIAKALGIPAAYIESALKKLVSSELMRTIGNRYATDFRIRTPEALERCLDVQIALTEEIYPDLLPLIHEYLESIRSLAFVGELSDGKRKKLEYYFILHLFSETLYRVGKRIFPADEVFPQRPDGGSWIAFGNRYPADFDFADARFARYSWAGERRIRWENIYNARRLELHIYDTQPELNSYSNGPVPMDDGELAKLLYLTQNGISAQTTGFNVLLLENIPHLIECGVLSGDEKHPDVALPIMRSEEYALLEQIRIKYTHKMADLFEPHLREYLPKLKLEIPKHLEGRVAEFRKYIWDSIPMVFMKKAVEEKDFDTENATPPMVFVVDERDG